MNSSLAQQVVVITGGAGRIGRVFCEAVARCGGTAIIADTAAGAAEQLAAELQAKHGSNAASARPFDVTKTDDINRAIDGLHADFGRIDAVVNNAYPRNPRYGAKFEQVRYEDFVENLALHLGGYFLVAQRFAAYFVRQGRGNIINMGSIYGVAAPRFDIYAGTSMTMPVEYAVIKSGVLHLTRYLAQYYKPHGVRVNALSPGGVFADQPAEFVQKYSAHAAGRRMLQADDLAEPLIFLLSAGSAHVTGQNLIVDDGWTL